MLSSSNYYILVQFRLGLEKDAFNQGKVFDFDIKPLILCTALYYYLISTCF